MAARDDQVRENRLRRVAERQGRTLTKSKLRDPNAKGYGTYSVSDTYFGAGGYDLTLDEVESHLVGEVAEKAKAEYDELGALVTMHFPDSSLRAFGHRGAVSVESSDIDTAAYLMQEYLDGGGLPLDYLVELHFESRQDLAEWLRKLPEPKDD
jgi:hypothetical protein